MSTLIWVLWVVIAVGLVASAVLYLYSRHLDRELKRLKASAEVQQMSQKLRQAGRLAELVEGNNPLEVRFVLVAEDERSDAYKELLGLLLEWPGELRREGHMHVMRFEDRAWAGVFRELMCYSQIKTRGRVSSRLAS